MMKNKYEVTESQSKIIDTKCYSIRAGKSSCKILTGPQTVSSVYNELG